MRHEALMWRIAALFEYPEEDYRQTAEDVRERINTEHPEHSSGIASFCDQLQSLTVGDLQELYVRTFEMNPLCALEVGWHLFGEEYARGEFLVKMRTELRNHGIPESAELPDHLSHVLRLAGRMDQTEYSEFWRLYLGRALEKMREGLKDKDSPYEGLLLSVHLLMREMAEDVEEMAVTDRR